MDQYKIDNFIKSYPGASFPEFQQLDGGQARAIRESIANSVGLPGLDGDELVKKLNAVSTEMGDIQASDPVFSVEKLLRNLGLASPEKVYLNWCRFDHLDQVGLDDLDRYFSDIWYPGVDDLDVFDDSMDWIVSIVHYGNVKLVRRQGK